MNDDDGPDQDSIDRLKQAQQLSKSGSETSFLQLFQNYQKSIASKPGALISSLPPIAKRDAQTQQKPSAPPQAANKSYTTKRGDENLIAPIGREGTTAIRKEFWDDARLSVLSLRKIAGRNVSVDEHPGKGTVVNVLHRTPVSACAPTVTLAFSGITFNCTACIVPDPVDSWQFEDSLVNTNYPMVDQNDPTYWIPPNCGWQQASGGSPGSFYVLQFSGNSSCTPPNSPFLESALAFAGFVGGRWYAILWSFLFDGGEKDLVMFYGNSTSMSSISNSVTCSGSLDDTVLDDPFIELFWGGPMTNTVISSGGTASISIP